jgi:hypothetical protein
MAATAALTARFLPTPVVPTPMRAIPASWNGRSDIGEINIHNPSLENDLGNTNHTLSKNVIGNQKASTMGVLSGTILRT